MKSYRVYVVAWEYNTGGGFDWYFALEDADTAFENEKKICNEPDMILENWTAARYDFETDINPHENPEAVTNEIDRICDSLFENAIVKYKAR